MKSLADGFQQQPAYDASRHSTKSTSAKGFTILEVLFVLAIAGIIMLIVFEAIPSLTRALRNSQRKHDATLILGAVSSYELKNSDNFPQNCSGSGSTACNACDGTAAQCATSSTDQPNDYFLRFVQKQLSYYAYVPTNLNPVMLVADYPQNNSGSSPAPNTNPERVQIYDYEKCDRSGHGITTSQGADYSSIVALYALEDGSGTASGTPQCQEL
jgi:prepilin-type N-terminal cleavage/methylation domain-containing protein